LRVFAGSSDSGAELARHSRTFEDFLVRVDARLERPTQGVSVLLGLRFRPQASGGEGYAFVVTPDDRTFRLEVWQLDGRTERRTALIDTTVSNAIRPASAWNRLAALAEGPDIALWINGQPVGRVRSERLHSGSLALGVVKHGNAGAINTGDARFADLTVKNLR
jgi:hypothetical protein